MKPALRLLLIAVAAIVVLVPTLRSIEGAHEGGGRLDPALGGPPEGNGGQVAPLCQPIFGFHPDPQGLGTDGGCVRLASTGCNDGAVERRFGPEVGQAVLGAEVERSLEPGAGADGLAVEELAQAQADEGCAHAIRVAALAGETDRLVHPRAGGRRIGKHDRGPCGPL